MFRFVRVLLIILATALLVLLAWAISGSWKNEPYLNNTYLLKIDLTNLNLTKIFTQVVQKRDLHLDHGLVAPFAHLADFPASPTTDAYAIPTLVKRLDPHENPPHSHVKRLDLNDALNSATKVLGELSASVPTSIPSGLASNIPSNLATAIPSSIPSEYAGLSQYVPQGISANDVALLLAQAQQALNDPNASMESIVNNIVARIIQTLTPLQLGLSQIYTVSFWGYCRGSNTNMSTYDTNADVAALRLFSSEKVNLTWCSHPKAAFALDPAALLKTEIGNVLNGYQPDGRLPAQIDDLIRDKLKVVQASVNNTAINLPQDLQNYVGLLNRLTKAGFALMLAGCILSAIAVFVQLLGCCIDPHGCCLSCVHFLFLTLMCVTTIVGCALTTATYLYVRKVLNKEAADYGIKCSLLINFYAFAWLGAAAAIAFFFVEVLGLICGCCFPHREEQHEKPPQQQYTPQAGYMHQS